MELTEKLVIAGLTSMPWRCRLTAGLQTETMRYRQEIDGLRALAVVPVILFHTGNHHFAGGFVGVDIFFVISGYLITGILLGDLAENRFSLLRFYERRARRILPALFTVTATALILGLWRMTPDEFADLSRSALAVIGFVSNFYFWSQAGYFAAPNELRPLLHTWSLGIEEQFYLLFPILLLVLWRLARRHMFSMLAAIALGSFAIAQYGSHAFPAANFYMLPGRFWELAVGSLCALYLREKAPANNDALALAGLGLLGWAFASFDEFTPFPSIYALAPVGGTALLILFAGGSSRIGRLLSLRPLVWIGLISYSLYLWHYVLFAYARIGQLFVIPHWQMGLLIAASFAMAWLSWRFVEQPFRKPRKSSTGDRKRVFATAAIAASLLGAVAFAGVQTNGFAARFERYFRGNYDVDAFALRAAAMEPVRKASGNPDYAIIDDPSDLEPWFHDPERAHILVVGNSHARDLFNVLVSSEALASTAEIARYGAQLVDIERDGGRFFGSANYRAADYVLIASRYIVARCVTDSPRACGDDIAAAERLALQIHADGKVPVLVSHSLEFPARGSFTLADQLYRQGVDNGEAEDPDALVASIDRAYFQNRYHDRPIEQANARLQAIARKNGFTYLDRADFLCEIGEHRCFAMSSQFDKYYSDYGHYSMAGARFFARRMDRIGWLDPLGLPEVR